MNINSNKIIYTVNTNNYDILKFDSKFINFIKSNYNFKYILFTDNLNISLDIDIDIIHIRKLASHRYLLFSRGFRKIIQIPLGLTIDRFIKFNPHLILPKHEISIYHDARICINIKFINQLRGVRSDFDWISVPHRYRNKFFEESRICFAYSQLNLSTFNKFNDFVINKGSKLRNLDKYSLSENGLIVRRNNTVVKMICTEWTRITSRFSCRDQISLILCLFYVRDVDFNRVFFNQNFNQMNSVTLSKRLLSVPSQFLFFKKIIYSIRYIYFTIFYLFYFF